jgi:hypothetical protein
MIAEFLCDAQVAKKSMQETAVISAADLPGALARKSTDLAGQLGTNHSISAAKSDSREVFGGTFTLTGELPPGQLRAIVQTLKIALGGLRIVKVRELPSTRPPVLWCILIGLSGIIFSLNYRRATEV